MQSKRMFFGSLDPRKGLLKNIRSELKRREGLLSRKGYQLFKPFLRQTDMHCDL